MSPDLEFSPKPPEPPRDEAYWRSLLGDVDKLDSAELDPADPPEPPGGGAVQPPISPQERAWEIVRDAYENDQAIELTVQGANQGGLLVEWYGLSGFIPASQLVDFPQFHLPSERDEELQRRVGQRLTLKIIELSPAKNRLIFSERAGLVAASQRERLWRRLAPGQIVSGHVTNMTRFGAFVDLGGVEGLIHLSELSWALINHPSEVVQPGQAVTVVILNIDRNHDRIALSLKRTRPDPWQGIDQRYQAGQMVAGIISKVVSFGAFVTLEDELEGLIHVSQLADGNFLHPRNVVLEGQEVTARILEVDEKNRRIALSLRTARHT